MDDSKKEEYNRVLKTLGKRQSKNNIDILNHIEKDIFSKEQKQPKHEGSYFYKFVFYYFKDHLKDKFNKWLFFKNLIKETLENWLQISTNIIILIFVLWVVYCNISYDKIKMDRVLIPAIILLITSLVTGSFFLIKIYIENQLNKKEKEMLQEYKDIIRDFKSDNNRKFKEQDKKFDELKQMIKDIPLNKKPSKKRITASKKSKS